ncbi:MAG TPA: hypothetical protein PKA00_06115 [Saprospiraceae bacterium]|nr:hypothetical protein [Saprospiraceae bacterium]HMQ82459.1 hypothetical protein [Saprospiraceae bacterium]
MANNTSFIIPINIQAIRVLEEDQAKFKGSTVNFSLLGGSNLLGAQIDQNLPDSNSPIDQGVHLHWSMPTALTHGIHDGVNDHFIFPRLPDRWLVTRYFYWTGNTNNSSDPNGNAPFQVSQWIIESNRLSPAGGNSWGSMITPIPQIIPAASNGSSPPTPPNLPTTLPSPPTLGFQELGLRSVYNANWAESADASQYDPNLRAISYYGPSFTAYYQNDAAVFGLSDDFSDLGYGQDKLFGPEFQVSYQVIGWYSDIKGADEDILSAVLTDAMEAYSQNPPTNISKLEFFNQFVANNLKWQLLPDTSGVPPNDAWPTGVQSIFNGLALDIKWMPAGSTTNQAFLPEPPDVANSLNLQLALGNNSAEALSALISKDKIVNPEGSNDQNEPYPELEQKIELLFNAFQQDLLRRLAGSDTSFHISQMEEYLHTLRFSKKAGGSLWVVRPAPAQSDGQINLNNNSGSKNAREVALPMPAAALLSLLNATQQTYDRQMDEAHSRQTQAFLDWTYWGLALANNSSDTTDNDNIRSYLESELMQVLTKSCEVGVLTTADNSAQGQAQQLQFQPVWTQTNTAAPAFIQPLATAQYQLQLQLPNVFQAISAYLAKALAALQAGGVSNALALMQTMQQDSGLQANLSAMESLLGNGAQLVSNLDRAKASLNAQKGLLDAAADSLANNIKDFAADNGDLTDFMKNQKGILPSPANLIDTQLIWALIETANYDESMLSIIGSKLLEAQQKMAATDTSIVNLVNIISNTQSAINAHFSILQQQVHDTLSAIAAIENQLQAIVVDVDTAITALQQLLSNLANYSASSNTSDIASSLQQAWQFVLFTLPSGHQVLLLVQILQQVAAWVDPSNVLQRSGGNPYFQPNDPVVLLTQPGNSDEQSLLPVNQNGAATLLPCRQQTDLLSALSLQDGTISLNITTAVLASHSKVPKVFANLGDVQDIVQQLIYEGFLLVPQTANDLVGSSGISASNLSDCQRQLFEAVKTAQQYQLTPPAQNNLQSKASSLSATYDGLLPYYISMNLLGDTNPFLPLFLAWTAEYDTLQLDQNNAFSADFIAKNFQLDTQHVELLYGNPAPALQCSGGSREPITMSGQITLSGKSAVNLRHQIRTYFLNAIGKDISKGEISKDALANDFQKDLFDVYTFFSEKTILSQGLNGFNYGLLQQLPLLQTPLNNIDSSDATTIPLFMYLQQTWNNPQWNKVTVGQTETSLFLPFRAGRMRLKTLYIVDAFGRFFQMGSDSNYIQNQIVVASSLQQLPNNLLSPGCNPKDSNSNDTYLPPRFIQPARLSFDWLSANASEGNEYTFVERTAQPAFTPITGWMLPNHLDDSLAIYDASGSALGSLGLEGVGRTLTWRSVPTAAQTSSANNGRDQMLLDIANANAFLQGFLTSFAFPAGGNEAFQAFLDAMDQSQNFIHTPNLQEDKGLAVLIGRPFVLARAKLRLELKGLPNVAMADKYVMDAVNACIANEKDSDTSTWKDYDIKQRFQANLSGIAVPLTLGDLSQFDDGLVGFFLNDDWSVFYTALSDKTIGAVQAATPDIIQLLPNFGSEEASVIPPGKGSLVAGIPQQELIVTMVMDPRAAVHASTGLLPVSSIEIPPSQYQSILHRLMVYFLSNPVLLGQQLFDMPLPDEKGYHWSWVQQGQAEIPLEPSAVGDRAHFGYSPQRVLDGWLKLSQNE